MHPDQGEAGKVRDVVVAVFLLLATATRADDLPDARAAKLVPEVAPLQRQSQGVSTMEGSA